MRFLERLVPAFPGVTLGLAARLDSRGNPLLGQAGEAFAARHLRRRGAYILGCRVRTPEGELDLVAEAQGVLFVVEVKTGRTRDLENLPAQLVPSAGQGPGRRLGPDQTQRLRRAAHWLSRRSRSRRPAELLLAEVFADREGFKHRCVVRPLPEGCPTPDDDHGLGRRDDRD